MIYCVSHANGTVGAFSSMETIKELVFDIYPSITFIIQVFKNSSNITYVDNKHIIWAAIYKNSDTYAYVSDNKEETENAIKIFDKIGKVYEDSIEYFEQEIDIIPECTSNMLNSMQLALGKDLNIDSSENIIYYT